MRKTKQELLNEVNGKAGRYSDAQDNFWKGERSDLIKAVREAKQAHCTQEEIAEAAGLSRQRIAQLLRSNLERR